MPNWFEQLTEPMQDVVRAAQEIVSDFDDYGEVLQIGDADEARGGGYGATSPIEQLRTALRNAGG